MELNISQQELAGWLEIPPATLSRYESGQRRWPPHLYQRACQLLGLPCSKFLDCYWDWEKHRAHWNWPSHLVEVDPGQTWASLSGGYSWFYRKRNFENQPPLEIKRLLRADTRLDVIPYAEFYNAGASTAFASITALNPPAHFLAKENGEPLGLARRAAIYFEDWLLWPQINFLLSHRRIRVDLLAHQKGVWVANEMDGPLHNQQFDYDRRRDEQLKIPVVRFCEAEILSGQFIDIFRERMARFRPQRIRPKSSPTEELPRGA
ncbi:MAG: helix-turn-helix transcriptional regulator [Candidatus Eremiobacteraeota bacterium]|nr:helix-turn-helix transcriptional regulator [Candidatus Eremiobacteraeota bacterium]MCW5867550.1 helix-turn-helix transcriptional regulator [Candidatus Eremiobacteraeota bacterium]